MLLLEAGGSDFHPFIRMPSAFSLPMNSKRFNWFFESDAEAGLGGRRLHCPRGKVIGGSSSINGMVYVRGNPMDFERWQAMGADGWGYADVLPYFKKAERTLSAQADDAYRGRAGPLVVTRGRKDNALYEAFLGACEQAGYDLSADLNGYQQEAFGDFEMTVDNGVRCSTARAYLAPALARENLDLVCHAHVQRLTFKGLTASGVQFAHKGKSLQVHARREVLLAAGAIGSPQLLMLSGIGPDDELAKHEIACIRPLAGVGGNLMDHLEVYFQQACTRSVSLNRWLNPLGKGIIGARWLATRSGLGATNHFEVGGFVRSGAGIEYPDIQMHFLPAAVSYDGTSPARTGGFQVHVGPMLSASRGSVRLRSANPQDKPAIRFNYLSDSEDWRVFRSAIRLSRELFAQQAFDDYRGEELSPGINADSDSALDAYVREQAESAYHPCGTCRMGVGEDAVVDQFCRVHGIQGLRVIDASVFPHITNGNLNAPVIMLAEQVADGIKGVSLPPEQQPFYRDPESETRQRPCL